MRYLSNSQMLIAVSWPPLSLPAVIEDLCPQKLVPLCPLGFMTMRSCVGELSNSRTQNKLNTIYCIESIE